MRFDNRVHQSVVNNYRAVWKKCRPDVALKLSDEEIWNCFDEASTCESSAEEKARWDGANTYDASVLSVIEERNSDAHD